MKRSLTFQCLFALALGILAGTMLGELSPNSAESWREGANVLIQLWTNALRLVAMPLVIAQVFAAISIPTGVQGESRRLGLLIPAVFGGLLVITALIAIVLMSGMLTLPVVQSLSPSMTLATSTGAATAADPGGGSWVNELVPPNLFAAASGNSILALMLFTIAFALAARRIAPELKQTLDQGARAVRDAFFVLVGWLIKVAPLVLLALGLRAATSTGLGIGKVLVVYTVLSSLVFVLCTLALYPLTVLLGGVSPGALARALVPAQAAAAASRSSLATVPVLLKESNERLRLPEKVSALVLPLAGAMLKLSRAASSPMKLVFLAGVLGIPLGVKQVAVFTLTILILSSTTPGVPRVLSGGGRSLPAYVSIGIPPDYVLLLGASIAVADVIETVLNSTGYMSANVIVSRLLTRIRAPAKAIEQEVLPS